MGSSLYLGMADIQELEMRLYPPIEIQQIAKTEEILSHSYINREVHEKFSELQEFWLKLYMFIFNK